MKRIKLVCKNCEKEIKVQEGSDNETYEKNILCLACGSFGKPCVITYEEKTK